MKKSIFKKLLCSFLVLMFTILSIGVSNIKTANAAERHNPVIFVHGLGGSSSNFISIENYMISNGWNSNELFAVDLPDKVPDLLNNKINSEKLDDYIEEVLRKTGKSKVDIVAHSMGGANTLYYIDRLDGERKVDKLITLGGANRLSVSEAPVYVKVTSIYSTNDEIVTNALSILPGANNIKISGVGHAQLLNNIQVKQLIVQILK